MKSYICGHEAAAHAVYECPEMEDHCCMCSCEKFEPAATSEQMVITEKLELLRARRKVKELQKTIQNYRMALVVMDVIGIIAVVYLCAMYYNLWEISQSLQAEVWKLGGK
jgi:hypothetical protein